MHAEDFQRHPLQLAQEHIASYNKVPSEPSPTSSILDVWLRFCAEQYVPAFPITPSLVALCIWWLSIKHSMDFYPFLHIMDGVWKATTIWNGQFGVEIVQGSLLVFEPIAEFLEERRRKLGLTAGESTVSLFLPPR